MWQRIIASILLFFPAFFVSLLPEKLKKRRRLEIFVSSWMHVLSGAVEGLLSAALFVSGLIEYVQIESLAAGYRYATRTPVFQPRDLMNIGAAAYLAYFLQPIAWLYFYGFLEGAVRAIEALLTDSYPGLAIFALLYRIGESLGSFHQRVKRRWLLGPRRPDEIRPAESSSRGLLEIYSAREKSWSDRQVLRHAGDLYVLTSKEFVRRGGYYACQYRFRKMHAGEIIRSGIIDY